ncbi:MAG TPA: hypothetical protein VN238_22785 [Solirubrobacteraceae bacterium]|nr:hypothetical protein [Solirubrobacteraceae bacterium]
MLHRLATLGLFLWLPGGLLVHLTDTLALDLAGGLLIALGLPLELLATALIVLRRITPDPPIHDPHAHHTAVAHTNRRAAPDA